MPKAFLLTFLLCCAALSGQEAAKPAHTIRASGEATISAQPDRAEISVAVSNLAETAETAADQNARQTAQVLEALKRMLGSGGSLKTNGYSINPEYQYEQGKAPQFTGYRAANSILAIIDNLALVGKVIDAATRGGANSIGGVSFTLRDDAAARSKALAEAALNARANAEAMAKALGLHIAGVLSVETIDSPVMRPLPMMQMKAMAQNTTPIESGTLDVRASVVITVAVQ